jgi:hypothetical protein
MDLLAPGIELTKLKGGIINTGASSQFCLDHDDTRCKTIFGGGMCTTLDTSGMSIVMI